MGEMLLQKLREEEREGEGEGDACEGACTAVEGAARKSMSLDIVGGRTGVVDVASVVVRKREAEGVNEKVTESVEGV